MGGYWFEAKDVTTGQTSLIYCPAAMTVGGRVTRSLEGFVAVLVNYSTESGGEESAPAFKRVFVSKNAAKHWVESQWAGPRRRAGLA